MRALALMLVLVGCGDDDQPAPEQPSSSETETETETESESESAVEPAPVNESDEPFRPLVVDGPAASWTDVNTGWWPNGLRPVAPERLAEVERATFVEVGAPDVELRWLRTPMVSANIDPTWPSWEAEHRMHSDGPAERIDGRVIWLNLVRVVDYPQHRPLLEGLEGPVAFHVGSNMEDELIRRTLREHSERYETGINAEGSEVTNELLAFVGELPGLRALLVWHSSVDDDGLAHLRQQTELRELHLLGTRSITDSGLVHLGDMAKLRGLDLSQTQVTDAGLEQLRGLTRLEQLHLANTNVTAEGVATIGRMRSLRDVAFGGLQVAAALPELRNLSLRRLEIALIGASDADLEHVAAHPDLEFLDIRLNDLTDAGLAHLRGLTKLRMLHLDSNERITDRGLLHLRGLTELRHLTVFRTGITRAGIRRLKRHLPNLRVSFVQI